jgi:hypothetical protein
VSKHPADEGGAAHLYLTYDPACATLLEALLAGQGIPALLLSRYWLLILKGGMGSILHPIVYQILVSSVDLETRRTEVAAALEEVRGELGEGSEMDLFISKTERY